MVLYDWQFAACARVKGGIGGITLSICHVLATTSQNTPTLKMFPTLFSHYNEKMGHDA